jgi:hypothetical protein
MNPDEKATPNPPPQPIAEIVINRGGDNLLFISFGSNDKAIAVLEHAPQYGHIFEAYEGAGRYTMFVDECYDTEDVIRYLSNL